MKRVIICSPLFRVSKFDTHETRVVNDFAKLLSVEYEVIVVKPVPVYSGLEWLLRRYFGWFLLLINGSIDLSSGDTGVTHVEGIKVHCIKYRRSFDRFIDKMDVENIGAIIYGYRPDSVVFHWMLPSVFLAEELRNKYSIKSSAVVHELDPLNYLARYGLRAERLSAFNKIYARNEHIISKLGRYGEKSKVLHSYYERE